MIDNINQALHFIETSHYKTVDQNNLKNVLKKYENFELNLKTVHVTGTNGKGSTSKMLSDVLINANYKTGLFTSPHMLVANDRIKINNQNISDDRLTALVNFFYDDIVENRLNFFQIYVLIALRYFYEEKVDIAIIEVGIGGRLDSTNVINSMVSLITNIGLDHVGKLGDTLEKIAIEKAGIIKANSITVTSISQHNLLKIVSEQANKLKTKFEHVVINPATIINDQIVFKYKNKDYTLNSKALYQGSNAQVVLRVIEQLNTHYNYHISEDAINSAFKNFTWIGRFEQVASNPNIILDGAHNISGIKALIESANSNRDYVIIFSAVRDKDYPEMLELLTNRFAEVVFCEFDFYRALKIEELSEFDIKKFSDFNLALNYLKTKYPNYDILVSGSLYFISEIRKTLVK